jgi:hypothetical protein
MRFRWPMPHEIATLYMILLLYRTTDHRTFHVPYRAADALPDSVQTFMSLAISERQNNPIASAAQFAGKSDQLVG